MCGIFLSRLIFLYLASSFVCGEGDFIGQMARWAVKFPEEFDDATFDPEEFEPSSDDDYMSAEPQYCLVLTARVTVEFTHNNSDHVVEVPVTASNGGACEHYHGQEETEHYHGQEETLRLWWPSHGGVNVVSITIARNGRVAYFSSATATVNLPSSRLEMAPSSTLEMATNLSYHGLMAPNWPLRYRLTCGERIKFPLYTTEQLEAISQGTISSDDNQPKATLHIHEDLELEAFRTDKEFPGPYGRYHSRTDFGCQFIQIYPAAPYMTALALVALLIFDLVVYYFRKRLGFKTHERAKISVNNNE